MRRILTALTVLLGLASAQYENRLLVGAQESQAIYPGGGSVAFGPARFIAEALGLGYLEHVPEEGLLRLISPGAAGPKALRLGSVRLEEGYRAKRVDLRNLFGSG